MSGRVWPLAAGGRPAERAASCRPEPPRAVCRILPRISRNPLTAPNGVKSVSGTTGSADPQEELAL